MVRFSLPIYPAVSGSAIRRGAVSFGRNPALCRAHRYPRHFDGGSAPSGHAALLSPGSVPPVGGDALSVCTAPSDDPVPGAALIPDRAVDGARIERTLCALFDRMESWEEDLLGCSPDRSGVQRMLEISAEAMNGSLGLIDESYNMPGPDR